MSGLLAGASALSGALAGFGAGLVGVVAAGTGGGGELAAPGLAALAVAAGAVPLLDAAVAPASVRRQVPQLWGRVFSARATAVLYGARLGVGPLTILRTWWWWLAAGCAALAGVWVSVAVGALFGAARVAVMLGAGTRAGARRRAERLAVRAGAAVAVVLAGVLAVSALSARDGGSDRGRAGTASRRAPGGEPEGAGQSSSTAATAPLGAPTVPAAPAPAEPTLGDALPAEAGPGFVRVPDDPAAALGSLDLAAAAALEDDEQAERSLLETRRFAAGWARAWKHADGRVAYLAVYRFARSDDAAAYLVDGFVTLESRGARVYDVADIAGARGFSQAATAAAASRVAHGVAFVRGERFYLAVVSSPDSRADPAAALAVAQAVPASRTASG